jgi:hypothetical protein
MGNILEIWENMAKTMGNTWENWENMPNMYGKGQEYIWANTWESYGNCMKTVENVRKHMRSWKNSRQILYGEMCGTSLETYGV